MKRLITFCIISFGMLTASMAAEKQPTDYVNPFIGTTNFGTTNPGAVCPNGMMSVVPFNRIFACQFERCGLSGIGLSAADAHYGRAVRGL